jgi:hypothetical protein
MTNDYYESTRKQIRDIRRRIEELRSICDRDTLRPNTTRRDEKVAEAHERSADVPVNPSEELKRKLLNKGK